MFRLPTSRLNEPLRSSLRFVMVGLLGTVFQYVLYDWLLWLIGHYQGHEVSPLMTNVAFTMAFVMEMVCNYVVSSYYTFSARPTWTNFAGFVGSRLVNYIIQMGLLNVGLLLFTHWEQYLDPDRWAGITAILVAGVINYFLLRILYRQKKNKHANL